MKRILSISIIILGVFWTTFMAWRLLGYQDETDFKRYFSINDERIVVVHQLNEVDWDEPKMKILPTNQSLISFLAPRLNGTASIYASAKRPLVLVERKGKWTARNVKRLFSNGPFKYTKSGIENYNFGDYSIRFKGNQLIVFKGEISGDKKLPEVDKKASYSVIQWEENQFVTYDFYEKLDRLYCYRNSQTSLKLKNVSDAAMLAGFLPASFNGYTFYQKEFFASVDADFKKSGFHNWIKEGFAIVTNGTDSAIVFPSSDGVNPIPSINEWLHIQEKNEAYQVYDKLVFSSFLKATPNRKIHVAVQNEMAILSYSKAYLDALSSEIGLGKSMSQSPEKMNFVFGYLPSKVLFRKVTAKQSVSIARVGKRLFETTCIRKDAVSETSNTRIQEYFSMNPGERITQFITLSGRGNVVVATETNKVIGYVNGSKRWEKQYPGAIRKLTVFNDMNGQVAVLSGKEAQVFDISGRLQFRFACDWNVGPLFYQSEGKAPILPVVDNANAVFVYNDKGKIMKRFKVNDPIIASIIFKKDKKEYLGVRSKTTFYYVDINKKSALQQFPMDSSVQVFPTFDDLMLVNFNNNQLMMRPLNGKQIQIPLKGNYELISSFNASGKVNFLLKWDKTIMRVNEKGKRLWEKTLPVQELTQVSVCQNSLGKVIICVLDGIENKLLLLDSFGNKLDEEERHGEGAIQVTSFGSEAFSITTYLGTYLIQYTK
ncbi:MAG: hypothetical protein RL264_3077 [Bacteroidota bacterium]